MLIFRPTQVRCKVKDAALDSWCVSSSTFCTGKESVSLSDGVFSPMADLVFVACCVLTNRKAGKAGFGCLPWQVLLQQNRAEHVSF